MTGQETARLISALERELPSRRNDELTERDRAERLLLWGTALKDADYMAAMKKLAAMLPNMRWFPRLAEVTDALNAGKLDPMDVMAMNDAEYRAMFSDWTHDSLTYEQRIQRMAQRKLAAADEVLR